MSVTQLAPKGDASGTSEVWRLSPDAIKRAKHRLNLRTYDDVAKHFGINRRTFYRLLSGDHDISLSKAMEISHALGWPPARVFEQVRR